MKRQIRHRLPLLLLILLAACATTSKAQLNDLLGKDISTATISLGKAPSSQVPLGGGANAYTWRWPLVGTGYDTTGRVMYEVVTVWTDSRGRIVRWQRSAE